LVLVPVSIQIFSGLFREDLCLSAGEAIEVSGTPSTPVDPVG
jgi:amidase